MPKNKAINLLPQEEFNASTTGRILRWATSTFRIIVIITEMVVMAAFLSRFWLDAQNSNLNHAIKIKSDQIAAQANQEKQFRAIQTKLSIFNQIYQKKSMSSLVDNITGRVPGNVTLSRLSVENGVVEIRGTSLSDLDISQFIVNLSSSPFKEATLKQVSTSENNPGGTDFTVSVTY